MDTYQVRLLTQIHIINPGTYVSYEDKDTVLIETYLDCCKTNELVVLMDTY